MDETYWQDAHNREHLTTCAIQELDGRAFIIPPFQRGYRWTDLQVKELLNDVAAFEPEIEAFYCLQPIVVRRRQTDEGTAWELIDGQQRLTTIWLIQRILSNSSVGHSLAFDTNTRQTISLKTLEDAVAGAAAPITSSSTLEASYIHQAAATIRKWKEDHQAAVPDLLKKLREHTQVIWYETEAADTEAQAIFSRLNAGKIQLTNAELIKALLLKRGRDNPHQARQLEMATDWNHAEAALGQPAFWGWLRQKDDGTGAPRIEWLLKLAQRHQEQQIPKNDDRLALFQAVQQEVEDPSDEDEARWQYWQRVQRLFQRLRGWFEDPDLYHRIGYLLATGDGLPGMLKLHDANAQPTKKAWLATLAQCIAERAGFADGDPDKEWDGLQYGIHTEPLRKILLLHNVATAWQARITNGRFAFDRYFAEGTWSLEHIHPQNPRDETAADQLRYLAELRESLASQPRPEAFADLLADIDAAKQAHTADSKLPANAAGQALAQAVAAIRDKYLPAITDFTAAEAAAAADPNAFNPLHALANLALLDGRANTALGNAAFPEKRRKVLAWHTTNERFVPPATLNVFLKMHSLQADDLRRWTQADRADYQAAMRQTVLAFLRPPTQPVA